jgi:hypothetical protein
MLIHVDECWVLPKEALQAPTVGKALTLIEECFFHAQSETLARVRQKLLESEAPPSDEMMRRSVKQLVRMTMRENLDDYDHPTLDALRRLISSLKVKASSWGTPPDIVEHHCGQITTLLARIPAKHRADVR